MTWAGISPLSPWVWLWDSSSSPVFSCPLHTACCSPLSEGHSRGTTPFVSQPVCCLCFFSFWFPTRRQVLGHLLYPEDGRQPGAEALCREKTGGAHVTPRSLLPGLCHVAGPHQAAWPPRKAGAPLRRAQKLSTARGCPENSSHRYFSPCFCLLPLLTLSLWSKSTELETEVRRS